MDKMRMESEDLQQDNVQRIAALFPNCVTEARDEDGHLKKAINCELLKQMLSDSVIDGGEAYEFTWVGKKASIVEANRPIRKTLRPVKEDSVNWDTTENLYIEGDNLEVLKLLQESYLGKVKMIYIDPPYNTGNDFIYNDDFKVSSEEYADESGEVDEEGNRMFKNTDSNGRFHSDWCSMIYSRLMLVRNLLSEDGVIFISIDDNEQENLKEICNEIFGKENFEGHIHWRRRHNQPNDKTKMIGLVAEHILVYAKNSAYLKSAGVGKLDLTASFTNPDNDPNGPWASKPWKVGSNQSGSKYTIVTPTGKVINDEWMGEEATYKKFLAAGRIYFPKGGDGMPRKKYYQFEREEEGQCATNWWPHEQFGNNQEANNQMTELFGVKNIFSNPKPVQLIRAMIKIANANANDICMDFFSGSATTAHAVMQLNAEDGGRRKFIMVQLPEETDEKSEAFKAGYKNICEIGKERIRRAAKKIHEDNPDAMFDDGFRVLKLDDTNMKDVYYAAGDYTQDLVSMLESNVKPDRTDLDLLFGCLLDWGLPLSLPYTSETIDGCMVHTYNDGDLIACFDENVPESVIKTIAKRQPLRAVFRDSSFASSPEKINVGEIFKSLAPDTRVKVI
jgi:adenine-specific DNA-methyltransferase